MENTIECMKEYYNANLKAREYNEKFNRILHLIRGNFEFILEFLHSIAQSENFQGSKLFEVGSGATVHHIASLSSKYSHIIQSDFVLDNCDELKRWHTGTSSLDWTQFLDIVLKIEGEGNDLENARRNLESRIRSAVKCVVRGDLLSDDVLCKEELPDDCKPPFDMIISVLCLETAAPDWDGYVAILERLNKLLRKGGGLIICGYELGSPWAVGGGTFHHIKLTLAEIFEALKSAGFKVCQSKTLPKSKSEYIYDYKNVFCLAAEKL